MQMRAWTSRMWVLRPQRPQAGVTWNIPALFTYLFVNAYALQNMLQPRFPINKSKISFLNYEGFHISST